MATHILPSEPCIVCAGVACKLCDNEMTHLHHPASGATKTVIKGFCPLTVEEMRHPPDDLVSMNVVTKFEIRNSDQLKNYEDRLTAKLRSIAGQCIARMPDIENKLVDNRQRKSILDSMRRWKMQRPVRMSGAMQAQWDELEHMLRSDDLENSEGHGSSQILVRTIEEDAGTTLSEMSCLPAHTTQKTALLDLQAFINGFIEIMNNRIFHFDMKGDNITCAPTETGNLRITAIDWGYGREVPLCDNLRSFAIGILPDFSEFFRTSEMDTGFNWKAAEFNMFWMLLWLMSYNYNNHSNVKAILSQSFTFRKAKEMLERSCKEPVWRFVSWRDFFPYVDSESMWRFVHKAFLGLLSDGITFCDSAHQLPSVPTFADYKLKSRQERGYRGIQEEDYLEYVGHFFLPEDGLDQQSVITRDETSGKVRVNWKFILHESGKIIHELELNPDLPDFVLSLCLKTYFMNHLDSEVRKSADLSAGELMLSKRMDCYGFVKQFQSLSNKLLPAYATTLNSLWKLIFKNPLTPSDMLRKVAQVLPEEAAAWDSCLHLLTADLHQIFDAKSYPDTDAIKAAYLSSPAPAAVVPGALGGSGDVLASNDSTDSHRTNLRLSSELPRAAGAVVSSRKRNGHASKSHRSDKAKRPANLLDDSVLHELGDTFDDMYWSEHVPLPDQFLSPQAMGLDVDWPPLSFEDSLDLIFLEDFGLPVAGNSAAGAPP